MRITGGGARGIPLLVPKGDAVRPAMDRLRQAVFSSMAALVPDARCADLFAGSGSYGLEAWSRGAAGVTFVERDAKALDCLKTNLAAVAKSLRADPGACAVVRGDALTWTPLDGARLDLIFVDPPYEIIAPNLPKLFERFDALLATHANARVLFEMPGELKPSFPGWECTARLGGSGPRDATACFFRRATAAG